MQRGNKSEWNSSLKQELKQANLNLSFSFNKAVILALGAVLREMWESSSDHAMYTKWQRPGLLVHVFW